MRAFLTFLLFNIGVIFGGGSLYLTLNATYVENTLTISQGVTTFLLSLGALPLLILAATLEENTYGSDRSRWNRNWFKVFSMLLGLVTLLLPLGVLVFTIFTSAVTVIQVLFAIWFILVGAGILFLTFALSNRW